MGSCATCGGPVDEAELERWLIKHIKRSVDHLVQGIRARWLTHDIKELQRATRIELLRCAARVVRTR